MLSLAASRRGSNVSLLVGIFSPAVIGFILNLFLEWLDGSKKKTESNKEIETEAIKNVETGIRIRNKSDINRGISALKRRVR